MNRQQQTAKSTLITLAALAIVIASIKLAKPIIVPFILAIFLAVVLTPPINWLQRRGFNHKLAVLTVIIITVLFAGAIVMVIGDSVSSFQKQLPTYQQQLATLWAQLQNKTHFNTTHLENLFHSKHFFNYISIFLEDLSGILSHTFLTFLVVIFMLMETGSFTKKLDGFNHKSQKLIGQIIHSIRQYIGLKSLFCLATGLAVCALALLLHLPFAELWGLIAGLLNFIPNIGAVLAGIPAVLFALITAGLQTAVFFAIGILFINTLIGSILEPRYMGKGLGLSTLVVFLSLTFWGWLLGAIGLLLSVPLTLAVKWVLTASSETRYLADLMSEKKVEKK